MRTDALLVCASLACLTALPAAPARAEEDPAPPVALRAVNPDGSVLGPCPLEHTDLRVEISGYVARTRVTHRFANPYDEPIEALYTFPLPEDAAVRDMEMQVGERLVRAEIRRRQAAREEYEAARRSGQTASLLDQERPNIFTTSVANVRPGVPVRVTLEYVETLPYEDGVRRLVFPMTVGPRYVPGTPTGHAGPGWSPDTDRVPDASRITPPTAPPRRSGHDIAVAIDLDAGVEMGPPRSPTHDVHVRRIDARRAHVELAQHDRVPNRDLVLEWPVSPERIASGVLAHRPDEDTDGYLTLLLQPNASPPPAEITPKEIVFVMDTSGSMNGPPMAHSRALMGRLIRDLHPQDSFAVLRYDTATSALSPLPLENTPANRRRALAFIDGLEGSGGTDALAGLRAAFAYPRDPSKLRVVVFLTDGYIGNEREILDEIQRRIGAARLFSFGVGSSVNRYLLEEMAREGRGDAAIVTLRDAPEEQVTAFYKRLQSPYLTDIEVDWGGLAVDRRFPERIPDLFAGQPLEVHARYRRAGRGTVRVRGRLAGRPFEQTLEVELPAVEEQNAAVASIWARERIAEIERSMHGGADEAREEELVQVALDHRLMSRLTSFVAVEHRVVAAEDAREPGRTVTVPVEMPEGVNPRTAFGSSLSLARFQPGDPELRVEASATARAVTALFPFGETKALRWEPRLGRWTTRFLVPRGTPEGNYAITILIHLADGTQERLERPYTVDASGPEVELDALDPVRAGATVRLRARQRFTAADRALHRGRRVTILSDVARLRVTTDGGERVALRLVEPGVWEGELAVPEDARGELELRVTAHDVAGNRGETTVTLPVTQAVGAQAVGAEAERAEDPASSAAAGEARLDASGLGEGAP